VKSSPSKTGLINYPYKTEIQIAAAKILCLWSVDENRTNQLECKTSGDRYTRNLRKKV